MRFQLLLSPMAAYGHPNMKPTIIWGTASGIQALLRKEELFGFFPSMLAALVRPWLSLLHRKMSKKDKRRVKKNTAVAKYQMVKKTLKRDGTVSVSMP